MPVLKVSSGSPQFPGRPRAKLSVFWGEQRGVPLCHTSRWPLCHTSIGGTGLGTHSREGPPARQSLLREAVLRALLWGWGT